MQSKKIFSKIAVSRCEKVILYISHMDGYVLFFVKNLGIEYKLGALSPHFIKKAQITKCDHSQQEFTDDLHQSNHRVSEGITP